jgi:hypothetical protein
MGTEAKQKEIDSPIADARKVGSKLDELEERIKRLEDRVLNVAPVAEPPAPPKEVQRLLCLGARRVDPEFSKTVLKSCVVRDGKIKVNEHGATFDSSDVSPGKGKLVIWGGRQNDVSEADLATLELLFETGCEFRIATTLGDGRPVSSHSIGSLDELRQASQQVKGA